MWTLGECNGANTLNVAITDYDAHVLIHLHHYFKTTGEDCWYPMKQGVTLNLDEWDKFNECFVDIDAEMRCLHCKNEQVE